MMKSKKIKSIGVVANVANETASPICKTLEKKLIEKNVNYRIYNDDIKKFNQFNNFFKGYDVIVAIGGDGTILTVLRSAGKLNVPIIGINAGRKGFLAEISSDEIDFMVDKLINGEYTIENRLMLEAIVEDKDDKILHKEILAVNDFNISRHGHARMIRLNVYINEQLAESFDADGVLIASPTGSTAYSLSAGGPIVMPGIECVLITPVCSHSLHTRPMIASEDVLIKVTVEDCLQDVILTVDGQHLFEVPMNGHVEVKKSHFNAKYIRIGNDDYYTRFREKIIQWSIN